MRIEYGTFWPATFSYASRTSAASTLRRSTREYPRRLMASNTR